MGIQRLVHHLGKTRQHRRGTLVISRVRTAGVLNKHSEIRASAKSHWEDPSKVPLHEEQRMLCKQGKARQNDLGSKVAGRRVYGY